MSEIIALNLAGSATNIARATHIARAVKTIREGYIVAAPLERGYAFITDAFNHDAVKAMHRLRGDALGVAAQVLVNSIDTAADLVRDMPPSARALAIKFWPGLLSLNLQPRVGLNWDLGDNKMLDIISIRVPSAQFVLELLSETGPLAVASAAQVGQPPINSVDLIVEQEAGLTVIFDAGRIRRGPLSSVVSCDQQGIQMLREGAISLTRIQAIVPEILLPNG